MSDKKGTGHFFARGRRRFIGGKGQKSSLSTSLPPRPGGSAVRAWLQLLRAPNLLTVPGDPIAGFVLAGASGLSVTRPGLRMALAVCVSLLMYAAGLIWNDWFDLAEDRRERPGRPLAGGRIRSGAAALVANVLIALAVAVAAIAGRPTLYVAMALGAAVLAYDAFAKRLPVVGPLTMGLCRGLSLLVGAAAFGSTGLQQTAVLAAAGGVTLYIAAVTVLAAAETRVTAVKLKCLLILAAATACVLALVFTVPPASPLWRWAMTATGAGAVVWLTSRLAKLGETPDPPTVQRTVGGLIRGLVLIQAAAVISTGPLGAALAAGLVVCFFLNAMLGRVFYAS